MRDVAGDCKRYFSTKTQSSPFKSELPLFQSCLMTNLLHEWVQILYLKTKQNKKLGKCFIYHEDKTQQLLESNET